MVLKRREYLIKLTYVLIDLFFVYFAIYLAFLIRQEIIPFKVHFFSHLINQPNQFRIIVTGWLLAAILVNNSFGLYQTKRELIESVEIWAVLKATVVTTLLMIVTIYLVKVEGFPRSILGFIFGFTTLFFSIWRVLKRYFVEYLVVQGYNNFNVLIVGAGKVGIALLDEIRRRPAMGLRVTGFLDDYKITDPAHPEIKILGKLSEFVGIARREFIHKVFITIQHDSKVFLQMLEQAKEMGLAVRVVPQGFDLISGAFMKYNIGYIPILEYSEVEYSKKQFGKRLFDFVVSFIAFLLLLPVFFIIAILIKLDSRGPVFYVSKRFGRGGKIFPMLKFRSMVRNADNELAKIKDRNEVDGPIFKMRKDPRVTRVGKFLRKYSLDELPQIINVINGQMSLVGPRPLPIDQIEREDLKQLKRLEVRPGITGLWQIRGRSDIPFGRLVKWDIWYINNWSFGLDLNILLQTVPVVLKGHGAY